MLIKSENDFNGSVKEVETKTVSLFDRNGAIEERLESTDYKFFDERKNLIESEYYYAEKQKVKTINAYDEKGKKINSLFYSDGLLVGKYEFTYDEDGKLIERKYFDENEKLVSNYQPVYLNEGSRIEETIYKPVVREGKASDGIISFNIAPEIRSSFYGNNVYILKTVYDAKDKLAEASFYEKRNRLTGKFFVVYDDKERPIKITKYGDDSSRLPVKMKFWRKIFVPLAIKLFKTLFKFHSAYILLQNKDYKYAVRCFKYGAPFSQTKIEYDENGMTMRLSNVDTFNINNQHAAICKYDENGNLIERKSLPENSSLSVYESHEYEYDLQNNWIKKKSLYKMPIGDMTRFMERIVLTTREIKYY